MSASDKPTVLIVGAGLGGLMLGALLEKSGVPYTIFERAQVVKHLGSAMAIGPAVFPIFQQLGIYEEVLAISKPFHHVYNFMETPWGLHFIKAGHFGLVEELSGYGYNLVARPKLYELLLKQVPAHKIHFGKRVLNVVEKDNKVIAHLPDNETFEGDIVVGADGAHSSVRQRMYDSMERKGVLPKSDREDLPFDSICLVGQTKVLDPKKFPVIALPYAHFTQIIGRAQPYSWHTFVTAQNTMCFMVVEHLPKQTSRAAMEKATYDGKSTEWTFHPVETMMNETRHFPIPIGNGKEGTLGDLYDQTNKDLISKVMLEDKVFKTWHHGRCVLMGDACHKLSPAGGHGAVTALHDAVALANLLYAMPAKNSKDITKLFEEYHKERYPAVMESYTTSKRLAKTAQRGIIGTILLYFSLYMPLFLWRYVMSTTVKFRPQAGFLQPVELMGTVKPAVSLSEKKARTSLEHYRTSLEQYRPSIDKRRDTGSVAI
ncbi:hypothetical protein BGW39_007863 [Mortierella sp. 14UC]|nr:hypothetical protein BGW39_007863 [Mortierella sp. 14UC]